MIRCLACGVQRQYAVRLVSMHVLKTNSVVTRSYAKQQNKGKSKKQAIKLNEEELENYLNISAVRDEMRQELDNMQEQYRQQLSVRLGVKAFETLPLQLSDTETVPLNHVAKVTMKNPQLVIINLSSSPQYLKHAVNAIIASGLNVSPQQQGSVLYAPLPRPSREHRERLAKSARAIYNQLQTNIRRIQHAHELRLRKLEGTVSKEIYRSLVQQLHETVHSCVLDAEKLMKSKEDDLLQELD